jgi:hypothetical protein
MKALILFSTSLLIISCSDPNPQSYPKLYQFSHVDVSEGKQWVVQNNEVTSEITTGTGTFGNFYDTLDQFVVNTAHITFFIEEIELISEDMIRLKFFVDNVSYDTTLSYTLTDQELIVDVIGDANYFKYDESSDEFQLCVSINGAINGENPLIDPSAYFLHVQECDLGMSDLLTQMKVLHDYVPGDSVGIFFPQLVYTN